MQRFVVRLNVQLEVEACSKEQANRLMSEWSEAVEEGYGPGLEAVTGELARVRTQFLATELLYPLLEEPPGLPFGRRDGAQP